ncbi:MAG TPA: hypothetical protein DIU18_01760 [Gemmatimonadetes bacterium]|nr:hypothetical protein [Gemmatimonadota bacterium]|tara:strand:- start:21882 stop:22289 length:408 start_codon:yes stop_codon:yes gene_type:complete
MILRRYGDSVQSVVLNFNSRALTEIGFRRDHKISHPAEVFFGTHERVHGHELVVTAEGYVQDEVEQLLLADLEVRVLELSEDEVLLVESEQGVDYPKTRTVQKTIVHEGENRLHFSITVHPPLRMGVYRKVDGSR